MTDQSEDPSKVQIGEPVSFIGVPYKRVWSEGSLTGAEITPVPTPAWVTDS